MRSRISAAILFSFIAMNLPVSAEVASLSWSRLPSIPDPEGFAAPFAGVSNGALIVAGGANIAGEKWGASFTKVWYDTIFVLEQPEGQWKRAGKLPRPLGYGVSITTRDGVVCIGGSDATHHYDDVFRLEWKNGEIKTAAMPRLPRPCANACGVLVGQTIYVFGGIETPTSCSALKTLWSLDLSAANAEWKEIDDAQVPGRMLAVAGALNNSFFVFSGASLHAGPDGKPSREYLKDAWKFTPAIGWRRLADMPRSAVAAPSPALAVAGFLIVPTGDDGANVSFQPVIKHPGFPRDVLSYNQDADAWSSDGKLPFSLATVPTVIWRGHAVIPNGEARPRVRTPDVWWAPLR